MNSNPLTRKKARKRLYFNYFKEFFIHFNGTLMLCNMTKANCKYIICMLVMIFQISSPITANGSKNVISSNSREIYNFNFDWRFIKEDVDGASKLLFDDSKWSVVSCPHTFNDIDTFDDFALGQHEGEKNQWRGTVWYRKSFTLPKTSSDKKIFIEFEGVRQIADVYINGHYLGKNQTGFIPFGYDLSKYIKFGETNVVSVKVNNDRADNFRDNFPLVWNHEHWHPNSGGIYRNVKLYVMNQLHVTLPLYDNLKTQGQYIYSENVGKTSADIFVETEIANESNSTKSFTIETQIFNPKGKLVDRIISSETIDADRKSSFLQRYKLLNPELWYTRRPSLYTIKTIIKDGKKEIDSNITSFGVRFFDFNKNSGFWLNGEYVKLHGWGQKPTNTWAGLGAALPDWLRDFTYNMMDEAGGNFIRWGHCAGSPSEISMGDKYGFVTLMPGVAGESEDHGETWKIRLDAFRDMVVYYRNHPSIFIWEGGNWEETAKHYEQMLEVIKSFDPKGKRLFGNRRSDLNDDSKKYVTVEVGTEGWERELDNLPIVESEYFRDESPRRSWDKFSPDDNFFSHKNINKNIYKETSEEYAVKEVMHWWDKLGKKAYHCGGANWVFSDGPHGGRCQTEVTRASGEVDAVRLPKEGFYSTKAMWRYEPQVHIIGHWNYTPGTKKTIYVVSNCQSVKLYVNNKFIAENYKAKYGYLFEFPDISWENGDIKAKAFVGDKEMCSQVKSTAAPAYAIKMTPILGENGWRADGSDIALIDVEVVDINGNRCPLDKSKINFTISGPAIWRGGYNSGREHSTNNKFLYVESGINRVAVKSLLQAGNVTITATADGLLPCKVNLKSQKIKISNGLSVEMPQLYSSVSKNVTQLAYAPEVQPYIPGVSNKSLLFDHFSYTGDAPAQLRTNLDWGKRPYTDLPINVTVIPSYLRGAEYVRMPNSDNHYWARDLLQFVAGCDMTVYVCHDDRVELPSFIKENYTDCDDSINIGDVRMSLYKYEAKKGESIIMSGNSDKSSNINCRMYLVFAKELNK